jgi:predicted O-methyltransferase YrrM
MEFPSLFTPDAWRVLARLREQDSRERATGDRGQMRVRALSEDVAHFLCLMVLHNRARLIAEFGTSGGCSTLYLASAARRIGGRVLTVDRDPEKTAWARENLRQAGLDDLVELYTADGAVFARQLPGGLGLVLVDFGAGALLPVLELLKEKIASGGLLLVDGSGIPGAWEKDAALSAFRRSFAEDGRFAAWIMPMGKEHLVAVRL